MEKIDFVILWVDGSDEKWLQEKSKYNAENAVSDSSEKFRDWDNLKYWFRGVEKYAPWVNNIFFITYGHLPTFLNVNHPKIKIINHKDYIDEKYLPTFNSNVLDLNIHRISGLSEKFVYFNDDVFIINDVVESDFFEGDMVKEEFSEGPITPLINDNFAYTMFNNVGIVNKYYDKKACISKNKNKLFNFKYGVTNNLRTILCTPYKKFVGFGNPHICMPLKKEYVKRIWNVEHELCEDTCKNKFRNKNDITLYLARYFQLLDGMFIPRSKKFGAYYSVSTDNSTIIKDIIEQKHKIICINDTKKKIDFEKEKNEINIAFEKILPEKSSFEL
ncbi:MAG: Stealth CR1 domain-containing protein [Clostridia bacterium]|nr:Stealth CR1 domain-containing protein [Clostridia bacterium]